MCVPLDALRMAGRQGTCRPYVPVPGKKRPGHDPGIAGRGGCLRRSGGGRDVLRAERLPVNSASRNEGVFGHSWALGLARQTVGGIVPVHGAAASNAAAARSTAASCRRRPTIWRPTGRPPLVKPQGTEITGRPATVMA